MPPIIPSELLLSINHQVELYHVIIGLGLRTMVIQTLPGHPTTCIVMYGGGLTSYEVAKRAIEQYGRSATEIWFADTRTEDEDLYRFNRDVEHLLGKPLRVFDQGMDIWEVFRQQRFLGNSRIDPCSKYLKRVPLRRALEQEYPNYQCHTCLKPWKKGDKTTSVIEFGGEMEEIKICVDCSEKDSDYSKAIKKFNSGTEKGTLDPTQLRVVANSFRGRIERCSEDGRFVRIVLGMDIIQDCDRLFRAEMYWKPFNVWFPLAEEPYVNKIDIIQALKEKGVNAPRLYAEGFEHNNCGGFCVKAGMGQMAHLYKRMPERFLYHEQKEQEFQEFIGEKVTILSQTTKGVRRNLSLRELRGRIEAGEDFSFSKGMACACLNPVSVDEDEKQFENYVNLNF